MLRCAATGCGRCVPVLFSVQNSFRCPLPSDVAVAILFSLLQASDAWELMSSMLKAAEEAVKTDDELEPEERQAAEDGLYSVRRAAFTAGLLLFTVAWPQS